MQVVFWLSFIFICYVYFGYPAVLVIWRRFAAQPVKKQYWEPNVSIVIAAHNERHNIERKLDELFFARLSQTQAPDCCFARRTN